MRVFYPKNAALLFYLIGIALAGCHSTSYLPLPNPAYSAVSLPLPDPAAKAALVSLPLKASTDRRVKTASAPRALAHPRRLHHRVAALLPMPTGSAQAHSHRPALRARVRPVQQSAPAGEIILGILKALFLLLGVAVFTVLGLILFPISPILGILCFLFVGAALFGIVRIIFRFLS
jgi:hypothetical protein